MEELNLDLNLCVGIGTDNCAVMPSEIVGAVKVINDKDHFAIHPQKEISL